MKIFFFVSVVLCLLLVHCKPKNEIFSGDSGIKLRFSTDTLWFDTLFTTVKSVTKRIKVYNPSIYAINISQISLSNALSPYSVIVNGQDINVKSNAELLGMDSLLILVKVTINSQDKSAPFIVEDSITFVTNGNKQQINLIAYGRDAIFHRNNTICDETWESTKPHIVIGMLKVDSNCVLKVAAGAKVYFGNQSGLSVFGTLLLEGSTNNKIDLRGYRTELAFENVAGQWSGIKINPSSKANVWQWLTMANASTAISISTENDQDTVPELVLNHGFIKNMDNVALELSECDIKVTNSLFTNCANYVVNSKAGGNQSFIHCTFTNYGLDFFRINPSVVFSQDAKPLYLKFYNNIVWGNLQDEFQLLNNINTVSYANNIIRTSNNALKQGSNKISTNRNFMKFKNIFNYDFTPDTLSPAIDSALFISGISDSLDVLGGKRDLKPDIGAIERPKK